MQFRLTKKFAKDFKLEQLSDPVDTTNPLDDWFIDVIRVARKKVAMVTHAKSTYTFFIPYAMAGGAKSIPESIIVLLRAMLHRYEVSNQIDTIEALTASEPRFCKTNDRKVLGHMNEYKRCIEFVLETEDIYAAEAVIADIPINLDSISTCPIEKLGELLNCPDKLMSSHRRRILTISEEN